jgi:3-dehydroquinate synthetase
LESFDLPIQIPSKFGAEAIYAAMASDKKKATGQLRFILLHEIGDVFITDQVSEFQVIETLRQCGAS